MNKLPYLMTARGIVKSYGPTSVLKGFDLSVAAEKCTPFLEAMELENPLSSKSSQGRSKATAAASSSRRIARHQAPLAPVTKARLRLSTRNSRCCRISRWPRTSRYRKRRGYGLFNAGEARGSPWKRFP